MVLLLVFPVSVSVWVHNSSSSTVCLFWGKFPCHTLIHTLFLSASLSLRCPSLLYIRTSCGTRGWMNGSLWFGCRSSLKGLFLPLPFHPLWYWHDNNMKQWTEQQQVLLWYYAKVTHQCFLDCETLRQNVDRANTAAWLWAAGAKVWESADTVMLLIWWTRTQ